MVRGGQWLRRCNMHGFGVLVICLILLFTTAHVAEAQKRKVVLGVPVAPPLMVHIMPYVARDMGFFDKYNLDVELIEFEGGTRGIRALIAGDIHIVGSASESVIEAVVAGAPVKIVYSYAHKLQSALLARSDVKGISDLRGRRMGIVDVGGFSHSLSLAVLEEAGIDPSEVEFVQTTTAGRVPALVTGQTHTAIMHFDQALLAIQREPSLQILVSFWDILPDYFYSAYMTSEGLIERDRQLVVDVLTALLEAARYMYTHKNEVVSIAVKENSYPEAIEAEAWDFLAQARVWPVNHGVPRSMVETTVESLIRTGRIPEEKRPTYEQLVDLSLIEEAIQRLGGPWSGDPGWM